MPDSIPWAAIIPVAILGVSFVAYCIVDIVRHDVKYVPKWAWIVISCVSMPLGAIIYLLVGRDANR